MFGISLKKIIGSILSITTLSIGLVNPCNVLSMTGGGSFGINEIAILQNLYDTSQIKSFDLITGVSAGGLNAGFLSYFTNLDQGLKEIQNIYFNLKDSDVYTNNELHILSTWALFDTTPLKNTLNNTISKLEKKGYSLIPTLIGSSNILSEEMEIFQFNHFPIEDKINILLASSAIPVAFPPVIFNDTIYNDGGLIDNEIILESIPTLEKLGCNNFNFLVVSAHPKVSNMPFSQIDSFWKYLERIGSVLANNFNNEISRVMELCSTKELGLKFCYPTSPDLEKYSILQFGNAQQLYNLSYHFYNCEEKFC